MTRDSGPEAGRAAAACKCGGLYRAWRRGVGVCLVMGAASVCFYLVSIPNLSRLSFRIHRLPEYNDFLMPSNTSVPLSPSSPQASPGSPAVFHESTGVPKGFLVHSPGCTIPDMDPMHHTIKRYVSKPKPIQCGKPPAFTSSRGSTLYLHRDILRLHFPAILKVYKDILQKLATTTSKSPTTKTTKTTTITTTAAAKTTKKNTTTTTATTSTTTTTTSRPTTPLNTPSPPPPSASSPPRKKTKRSAKAEGIPEDVKCCYKGIYRVEQTREKAGGSADGRWRYSDTCKALNNTTTEVEEDAVLVECRIGTVVVYKNVHYFFHRKKSPTRVIISLSSNVQPTSPSSGTQVTQEANKTTGSKFTPKVISSTGSPYAHKPTSHGAASTHNPTTPKPTVQMQRVKDAEKLNVVIMGTDSASRLNMLRHLSKTYEYLTKELGAVDLKGYNKVGDNTFPNLVATLGGFTHEEVDKHTCVTKSRHYDDCPWIWKDFKRNDYITAHMEDAPWMGSFHYLRRGFIAKPTDYYGRPFMLASEKEIGGPAGARGHLCQGNVLSMKVVQDYALEYARAFLGKPFFGFFWSASLTHDDLNRLHDADELYLQYLQQMKKMGAFNNTALFFVSDHGMRWGGIRSTYIGMLEERLPYVVLYLPPWFRKKYHQAYANLVRNVHRLTSNFDVHVTLEDLAYGRFADNYHVTSNASKSKRGISLFRNIPWNRTCKDANIPIHFCSCQDTHELTKEDAYLVPAANHFLETLNQQLLPYPQCEQFTTIKVLSAHVSVPNKEVKPKEEKSEMTIYLLQASLIPGDVVVEASLRHTKHDNSFKVVGDVSRINKYGSTSACVRDDKLRKYCYCKDQGKAKQLFKQYNEEQGGTEMRNSTSRK